MGQTCKTNQNSQTLILDINPNQFQKKSYEQLRQPLKSPSIKLNYPLARQESFDDFVNIDYELVNGNDQKIEMSNNLNENQKELENQEVRVAKKQQNKLPHRDQDFQKITPKKRTSNKINSKRVSKSNEKLKDLICDMKKLKQEDRKLKKSDREQRFIEYQKRKEKKNKRINTTIEQNKSLLLINNQSPKKYKYMSQNPSLENFIQIQHNHSQDKANSKLSNSFKKDSQLSIPGILKSSKNQIISSSQQSINSQEGKKVRFLFKE